MIIKALKNILEGQHGTEEISREEEMNIFKKLKQSYIYWWHLPIGEKFADLLVIIVVIATLLALMFVNNGGTQ